MISYDSINKTLLVLDLGSLATGFSELIHRICKVWPIAIHDKYIIQHWSHKMQVPHVGKTT